MGLGPEGHSTDRWMMSGVEVRWQAPVLKSVSAVMSGDIVVGLTSLG